MSKHTSEQIAVGGKIYYIRELTLWMEQLSIDKLTVETILNKLFEDNENLTKRLREISE